MAGMSSYITDILAQPQALRDTLNALQPLNHELDGIARALRTGRFDRVILTGIGGSYAALYPLWSQLAQAGVAAHLIETSVLLYDARALVTPNTLLIIVSQSGRSAEIVRLLDMANGATVLAITNTADSPLMQRALAAFVTQAGEEGTVSCKTFVTALAALALCGELFVSGDWQAAWQNLMAAANTVDFYVGQLDALAERMTELVQSPSLVLCGRGSSMAAALCGGLIIKEAAKFHSEGMGSAAFRHGPLELATTGLTVFVYEGLGEAAALNRNLVADVNKAGGHAYLIGSNSDEAVLRLPQVPPVALPIIEILPAQMLSVGLARRAGREPGKFLVSGKVTATE
jgi:glucosamine--fructose-6-phosphate aminotransferase (isomerizing)